MKITFLTTQQSYWGGSEELWVRIAELAIGKGHQVQVVVYAQEGGLHPLLEKLKKKAQSFSELQNNLKRISSVRKKLASLKGRFFSGTLNRVELFAPDCIFISQANNFDAAFYQPINQFLLKYRKPFFLLSQFNYEHRCLSYTDIKKARTIFNKAEKIFFVSKRNKEVSERQLAKVIENATLINNPLNLSDPCYIPYPGHNQIMQFASVARLDISFKGQDILFQVLSGQKWKKREWHLNIYGTGDDERYLTELSDFYGLKSKVTFRGYVTNIKDLWKNNHALLLPSISEGKPLALEEAMICGRIGVVSDVGGNAELIDDGINGYLASSFFPVPFEDALERSWLERAQWQEMGMKAHKKMLEVLDLEPEKTLLKIIELLK